MKLNDERNGVLDKLETAESSVEDINALRNVIEDNIKKKEIK